MAATSTSKTRPSLAGTSSLELFHVELDDSNPSSDGEPEPAETGDASERLELVTTQRPFRGLTFVLRNPIDRFSVVDDQHEFITCNIGRDLDPSVAADETATTTTASPPPGRKTLTRKSFAPGNNANGAGVLTESDLQGQVSDYTLYDGAFSRICLTASRVTGYHWTQLRHRAKHADLEIYLGNNYQHDPPLATLRCASRASRVLQLQRFHDKGVVYTLTKDKIMGHRVFYIAEGKSGACRMVLVVRKGRATVKFMTDPDQKQFNATCLEYSEGDSTVKLARGMDLVLAFACLCLADRFERYASFATRSKFVK